MKTAVVVGLFVLIACLQLQANGAEFRRRATDCGPETEDVKNTCHLRICDEQTGQDTVQTCPLVGIPKCEEGQVQVSRGEDLTKPYPECCSALYCSDP